METATTFFSLLTLMANGAVVVWLVAVAGGRRTAAVRSAITDSVAPATAMALALLIAAVSLGGSLYYSESVGLEPCLLCWYQRIAMYPLVAIFGVGLWRRDRVAWQFAMPLVIIGTIIAGYHYLIQRVPSLDAGACSIDVPCSTPYFLRFGFVSFPYMSISAFAAIAALAWIARDRAEGP